VRKRKVPSNAIQKGDKKSSYQTVISIWPLAGLLSSKLSNVAELLELKKKKKTATIKKSACNESGKTGEKKWKINEKQLFSAYDITGSRIFSRRG